MLGAPPGSATARFAFLQKTRKKDQIKSILKFHTIPMKWLIHRITLNTVCNGNSIE